MWFFELYDLYMRYVILQYVPIYDNIRFHYEFENVLIVYRALYYKRSKIVCMYLHYIFGILKYYKNWVKTPCVNHPVPIIYARCVCACGLYRYYIYIYIYSLIFPILSRGFFSFTRPRLPNLSYLYSVCVRARVQLLLLSVFRRKTEANKTHVGYRRWRLYINFISYII